MQSSSIARSESGVFAQRAEVPYKSYFSVSLAREEPKAHTFSLQLPATAALRCSQGLRALTVL